MTKQLIIAEKPSVAADISRALRGFVKRGDYYENEHYVLSSAIGHLLELAAPEEHEVKRGKWKLENLPIIPPHFDLKPIEKTEVRLRLLAQLIKRKDVTGLINACDAGREGELIFRHIVRHTGTAKPIERLWLQSMTAAAIREGFAKLRGDREMLPLADAAVCRSEADWLVGINATRAMTAFNSQEGGFYKTPAGRVQTPTLAILVEREQRIKSFVPREFWEVRGTFAVAAGEYEGRWFDEKFAKDKQSEDGDARPERIWDEARAVAIRAKCLGKPGEITEERKRATQLSPLLFDLTSLQRAANQRFGYSARMTLSLAQALYEKHKALTYPRTDSRWLPEDYVGTVKSTLGSLLGGPRGKSARAAADSACPYASFARKVLESGWVRPNKRIFNNARVSDHFAIIPTAFAPKHLHEAETKLYDLVVRRFLAVFYPPAEYDVTTRITRVSGEAFKSEGRVMVTPGWLEVYGRDADDAEAQSLAAVRPGESARSRAVEVVATQTKPPARFTEATLLTAMEGAGKLVEDEELREAMKERGLGTPATRAVIIEKLLDEEYIVRNGRELQPTPKAFSLIALLRGLDIPELRSPELTGDWEFKLKQMEHGKLKRAEFMQQIKHMTRRIVEQVKKHRDHPLPGDYATLPTPCPKCGGVVKEDYRRFRCEKCGFAVWRVISGRQLEPAEVAELLAKRALGPLTGFRSRLGRPFAAVLRLTPEFKVEFDFGLAANADTAEAVDFSGRQSLGLCPKCGAAVYEHGMAYLCERAVGAPRRCDFRSGKIILQRGIEPEQMRKLLATGRTDLLHRFISKKGRPFSAFLVRSKGGTISFEFATREAKAAGAKTRAKPARPKRPAAS
ncbi:MAG: DNA topoisomerase III [Betaproteobacteria bacterium]|nr:DNA topoisomerase III [Betaproteobacteria bacterium]